MTFRTRTQQEKLQTLDLIEELTARVEMGGQQVNRGYFVDLANAILDAEWKYQQEEKEKCH